MKRFIVVLMLFLLVVSPISANRGTLLLMAAEGLAGPLVKLMPEFKEVSTEVTILRQELMRKDLHNASARLGLPAGMTSDSLVARLDSLPVNDKDREIHRNLLGFLTGDGPVPYRDVTRTLEDLRYLAVHYGDSKGEGSFFFPCPGCGPGDSPRRILNSDIVNIAKTKVPTERVELERLLNSALAGRKISILYPTEMDDIPLEYKQVWALMFQVANYGQGYFKTIADAVLDGMKTLQVSYEDTIFFQYSTKRLLYPQYFARFYRLLFVEKLSLEEVEIWIDIINRIYNKKPDDLPYGERYKTMNGYAAIAEEQHDSDMANVFPSKELREEMGWEEFSGTVDEYVASVVSGRRDTFKELFDSSTVEAVRNAGTLMRRDIMERIRHQESSRRGLRAAVVLAEELFDDPDIIEAFRNARNFLERNEITEGGGVLRSVAADLLVFLYDNPNVAELFVRNATQLVVTHRMDIEIEVGKSVRETVLDAFGQWLGYDTIDAIRNADNLVRTKMAGVEGQDRRTVLTALEELVGDPVIIGFLRYIENWVEQLNVVRRDLRHRDNSPH